MLTDYIVATDPLPPLSAYLKEYILARNGVFVRAARKEFSALIPIAAASIPGLPLLQPQLELNLGKVPVEILHFIWQQSCIASDNFGVPIEALFYICQDCKYRGSSWQLTIPKQIATATSCQPQGEEGCLPCIDVHSHHQMPAFFSATDDEAEQQLRIYAVIGEIFNPHPAIEVRIGIYGHFCRIPASWVFELPNFFVDMFHVRQLR